MDKKLLISVILPVYNGETFLKQSIESVINQTYSNWELIIVDDCSTDNTIKIVQEYAEKDNRISIISNETNKKLPASLNIGFKQAKGEYFTWTSDDNYYYENAFEKMICFLNENSEYGMVYARCKLLNCSPKLVDVWGEVKATRENLLDSNICGACFLYRKSIANKIGDYNENKFLIEDYDYWLRLMLQSPIANIDEELYAYRLHDKSLTTEYKNKAQMLGFDVAIEYLNEYIEKFPELQERIHESIFLRKAIRQKNEVLYQELKRRLPPSFIYPELKRLYLLKNDRDVLQKIANLGLIYTLKALKLMIKEL